MTISSPLIALDHLVLCASDLLSGVSHIEKYLGITPTKGGRHSAMGTHNRLAKTGSNTFVEVLAIDPDATPPNRPRWFGLDGPVQSTAPRLTAWVISTTDIDASLRAGRNAGLDLGTAVPMLRDSVSWRISVRSDGTLLENGIIPVLIEWNGKVHPSNSMDDVGLSLDKVSLHHPHPQKVLSWLRVLGAEELVEVTSISTEIPYIEAAFTSLGQRRVLLSSLAQ